MLVKVCYQLRQTPYFVWRPPTVVSAAAQLLGTRPDCSESFPLKQTEKTYKAFSVYAKIPVLRFVFFFRGRLLIGEKYSGRQMFSFSANEKPTAKKNIIVNKKK